MGGTHAGDEPVQNVGHDNIDSDLEGNEEGDSETDTDDSNDEVVSPKKRKRCSNRTPRYESSIKLVASRQ